MAEPELWDEFSERLRDLETAEFAPEMISPFLALPGLRGFWPMSAFQSNGDAFDQSGNGRLLTYNGNPTYNFDGLAPYIDLDGVGDVLSRADEAGLDILGTETYVAAAARGLSMGGYFYFNNAAAAVENCIAKWNIAGNQRAYRLVRNAAGNGAVEMSSTGADFPGVVGAAIGAGTWTFMAGRFDVANVYITVDDVTTSAASGIAALFNSNAPLLLGARGTAGAPTELMTGRESLCFLCATFLPDGIINSLFQQTRGAFGV